jgi:DNA-binding PadR family transcriptional regulator
VPRDRKTSPQTLALLAAFLERPRAFRYGYDLATATQLKSGTIYPALMRLADRGFLDFQWEASEVEGRPARRMYRLTATGLAFARAETRSLAEVALTARHATGRA